MLGVACEQTALLAATSGDPLDGDLSARLADWAVGPERPDVVVGRFRVREGSVQPEAAVEYVQAALRALADPEKAGHMAAYMKTSMPFYGVQKSGRIEVMKRLRADFLPTDREDYERLVLALWNLPHREEKYLALGVARAHKRFVVPASLPLYRRLITEGAWWDLVDEVATHLVRDLVVGFPDQTWPEVERWVEDPDMWLRRSAVLCQVGAKGDTDTERLFRFCRKLAQEKEFFIRKAIGWALRDYAWHDAEAVAAFVRSHGEELSPLSRREATKHIGHLLEDGEVGAGGG